jgi:hypothetical protein
MELPYLALYLNSESGQRLSSGLVNRWRFDLNASELSSDVPYGVHIKGATFDNLANPVDRFHNIAYFQVNSLTNATYSATVPPGFYPTGADFATALETAMNAAGSGVVFTIAYSAITLKLTITCDGVNTVKFVTGTNHANSVLGVNTDDGFSNVYTPESVLYIAGAWALNIVTNLPTNSLSSDNISNILSRFNITGSYGSTEFYQANTLDLLPVRPGSSFTTLEVELLREDGTPFELPVQATWSMNLLFYRL